MSLLFALLLQAPTLQESASTDLAPEGPWVVKASSTGKFVALVHLKGVVLLEIETLKKVKEVEGRWTGLGFDEKDQTLTLAGESMVRYSTATWEETFRGKLEGAIPHDTARDFVIIERDVHPNGGVRLGFGESLVGRDGTVTYVTQKGGLSTARVTDGKIACEKLEFDATVWYAELGVRRILAGTGPALIVQMEKEARAGVLLLDRKRVYPLAASDEAIGAALLGPSVALLCRTDSGVYSTRTWKHQGKNPGNGNVAGTFDPKRSLIWAARAGSIVAWSVTTPDAELKFADVKGDYSAMYLSGDGGVLYAMERKKLRSWKVKD